MRAKEKNKDNKSFKYLENYSEFTDVIHSWNCSINIPIFVNLAPMEVQV